MCIRDSFEVLQVFVLVKAFYKNDFMMEWVVFGTF